MVDLVERAEGWNIVETAGDIVAGVENVDGIVVDGRAVGEADGTVGKEGPVGGAGWVVGGDLGTVVGYYFECCWLL